MQLQGRQYRRYDRQSMLKANNLVASMSRRRETYNPPKELIEVAC